MIYYSQFKEDEIFAKMYLPKIPKSHYNYVEMGALDGVRYSNTKTLEDFFGWTGILIEPVPYAFSQLKKNRPNNILVNSVISSSEEPIEFIYYDTPSLSAVSAVSSTLSENHKDKWFSPRNEESWLANQISNSQKKVSLIPRTLDSVISESGIQNIGLLSIDVEGHEYEVLNSYSKY